MLRAQSSLPLSPFSLSLSFSFSFSLSLFLHLSFSYTAPNRSSRLHPVFAQS